MKVLMVGVSKNTKGGMWTVVENYLNNAEFKKNNNITYIPTSTVGCIFKRIIYNFIGIVKVLLFTLFNKYDILHVHMSEKGSVYRKNIVLKIGTIRKVKKIIHMHGAEFEKWYKMLNLKKQKKVRGILNSADKIIILGTYWKPFIESLLDDKNKLEIVYNAVECPKQNNYDNSATNLLFLGVVGKRKGIFDLLDAMKIIKESHKNIILTIYGPDDTNKINSIIEEYNLRDFVKYMGWLDKENKESVLKKSLLNILPSYNEGLPMTILETMSYGIPNISTNIAAIPEVINDSNGILVNPGDSKALAKSIIKLIDNPEIRIKMSLNSYNLIKETFSVESHLREIEKIYKELITNK